MECHLKPLDNSDPEEYSRVAQMEKIEKESKKSDYCTAAGHSDAYIVSYVSRLAEAAAREQEEQAKAAREKE